MPIRPARLAALALAAAALAPVRAQAQTCTVRYYGGPVVSDVQVVQVDWGTGIDAAIDGPLGAFFTSVLDSPYLDWLVEYDTSGQTGYADGLAGSNQTISRGTFGGRYVITPSTSATTVADATVAAELAAQIAAGKLPAPVKDGAGHVNTLYMVEFPSSITIQGPNGIGNSCVTYCAYHMTFSYGGADVPYAVMPDASNGLCAGGCGSGTHLDNATTIHSHQIVETITDPQIGLVGGSIGRPAAWYSDSTGNCGEISDICNLQTSTVGGYTVQKQWSRVQNACVVGAASAIPICNGSNGPTCRRCVVADQGRAGGCTGATPSCNTSPASATYGQCVAAAASTGSGGGGGGCATASSDPSLWALLLVLAALARRSTARSPARAPAPSPRSRRG